MRGSRKFVGEGPNLITFLVEEGMEDLNTT